MINDVSQKQSIFIHLPVFNQVGFLRSESEFNIDEGDRRYVWDYDDEVFCNQFEKWGVENIILGKPVSVIRQMRTYIEYGEINRMKKSDQRPSTIFVEKYGGLDLYHEDVKKRYTIDHEDVQFFRKKSGH